MKVQTYLHQAVIYATRRFAIPAITAGILMTTPVLAAPDSVSPGTYEELTTIQEQIGNNQIDEANSALLALHSEVEVGSLDEALVLQMLGYTEMSRDNYAKAVDYLRRALELNRLPEKVKYNVGYMVAQLYAAQEKFDDALGFASEWFKTLEKPTPDQYVFMANIFAQTGNYKGAIPYVNQAISSVSEPKESWYQLLIASNFELKQYTQAADALRGAIQHWPNKPSYWEQLASVYVVLDNEKRALATLRLAWKQGVLEKENSVKSMVQLAISRGIPEHGARLLENAMAKEVLPSNAKYLDLLANAWVAAKEQQQAIQAFEQLAQVTGKGDPYLQIANLHIEQAQWQQAQRALSRALDKKLKEPGKAWLLLGIAYTEQKEFGDGMDAFRKAQAFSASERQAKNWLKYAEDLKRQHNWVMRNQQQSTHSAS
ncbi:tetratricopeptide repeat protein [Echinimonas agarilytica]|uniref:Tetratricopeptide repeat protein n=1 Tax=Echinimonas agarilytica TaxID=1215918 RepID=A0AA41W707_9GAMM|nr:tetratricopeptide repeat protein [Echinimonas agarilytica]MCM2680232.1 tetratricopeptide repeat protein [Echinimonas agarilytica]